MMQVDLFASMVLFRRVAEAGSFSAVAREMGCSQPTVSKQVAALEERLGNKLISRSTRQLTLTEAGKHYYDRCVRILDEIAETEATISLQHTQATGTLRIHAPTTFGRLYVLPHVWTFLDLYPNLTINGSRRPLHGSRQGWRGLGNSCRAIGKFDAGCA